MEILLIVPVNERGVNDMNKELVGFESTVSIGTCLIGRFHGGSMRSAGGSALAASSAPLILVF